MSFDVLTDTKASVVVTLEIVNEAPSITSSMTLVGLVILTPSIVKFESNPDTVSALVLRKESEAFPLPPP